MASGEHPETGQRDQARFAALFARVTPQQHALNKDP